MVNKTITVNGIVYKIPKIGFNEASELEDLGFDFKNLNKRTFSSIRVLLAYVMNIPLEKAGEEFEKHLENSETGFEDISKPLFEAIGESDFFQKLAKQKVGKK